MKTIHLIYFDAGGGHRSAALALREVIAQQQRPWQIELVNLQELLDPIDPMLKWFGTRSQDVYNNALKHGWTLGFSQLLRFTQLCFRYYHDRQVELLRDFWRAHPVDLAVSLVPNLNRAVFDSLQAVDPSVPLMTVLTDLADLAPHFWIEQQPQYLVCGTDKAVRQARALGHDDACIFRASGTIVHPRFYAPTALDRAAERIKLGLDPDRPTAVVLFGGHGSDDMMDITQRLRQSKIPIQLILLCGHNRTLAERLAALSLPYPVHIEGFTSNVPYFMQLADFFIGKPGPGSVSEALAMKLPVIVERNVWTLPQERYNTDWIKAQGVGLVLGNFKEIDAGVEALLAPGAYARFRERAAAHRNAAVFEIPDLMERVMQAGPPQPNPALGEERRPEQDRPLEVAFPLE